MGLFALTSGLVADCLNFQDWTTLTIIRKLFTCCGQFVWTCHSTTIIMSSQLMLDYSLQETVPLAYDFMKNIVTSEILVFFEYV